MCGVAVVFDYHKGVLLSKSSGGIGSVLTGDVDPLLFQFRASGVPALKRQWVNVSTAIGVFITRAESGMPPGEPPWNAHSHPAKTRRLPNVGSMLARRQRRRSNIERTLLVKIYAIDIYMIYTSSENQPNNLPLKWYSKSFKFAPIGVVSCYRDSQLQVDKKYLYLCILNQNICHFRQSKSHYFLLHLLTRWTRDYYATELFLKRDYFMTS